MNSIRRVLPIAIVAVLAVAPLATPPAPAQNTTPKLGAALTRRRALRI